MPLLTKAQILGEAQSIVFLHFHTPCPLDLVRGQFYSSNRVCGVIFAISNRVCGVIFTMKKGFLWGHFFH